MDKRSKQMFLVTIILLFILIAKSTLIDPVVNLTGDSQLYKQYMAQTAPLRGGLLEKTGLLSYRVVKVKKDKMEGSTEVLIRYPESDEWNPIILEGEYLGKVRAYLLYFIPIKDINFKGGIVKDAK